MGLVTNTTKLVLELQPTRYRVVHGGCVGVGGPCKGRQVGQSFWEVLILNLIWMRSKFNLLRFNSVSMRYSHSSSRLCAEISNEKRNIYRTRLSCVARVFYTCQNDVLGWFRVPQMYPGVRFGHSLIETFLIWPDGSTFRRPARMMF